MFQGRVLPEPFAVIGVARSQMTNEQFRARMREAIADFARVQPPSPRVWDRFAQALFYYAGDPADPDSMPASPTHLRQVEQERGTGGNRLFYCATPPSLYPHARHAAGRGGPQPAAGGQRRVGAHHHREAVRPRPGLGARAEPGGRVGVRRGAGLPDRPLPRQGDGPEHPGLPLGQRHLRAALEPQARRPRADHGGRDASASRRAAPTTRKPARCAT